MYNLANARAGRILAHAKPELNVARTQSRHDKMRPTAAAALLFLCSMPPVLVMGQSNDALRLAKLEAEVASLKAKLGRPPDITCKISSAHGAPARVSVKPLVGGGFELRNSTAASASPPLVLLTLVQSDTEIEVGGLLVRVSLLANVEDLELDETPSDVPFELLVGGNVVAMVGLCAIIAIAVVLEKKFQCIGAAKIHEMVEQAHMMQEEVHKMAMIIQTVQDAANGNISMADLDPDGDGNISKEELIEARAKAQERKLAKAQGSEPVEKISPFDMMQHLSAPNSKAGSAVQAGLGHAIMSKTGRGSSIKSQIAVKAGSVAVDHVNQVRAEDEDGLVANDPLQGFSESRKDAQKRFKAERGSGNKISRGKFGSRKSAKQPEAVMNPMLQSLQESADTPEDPTAPAGPPPTTGSPSTPGDQEPETDINAKIYG